ncbi:N-methyl-L-tryptophan oxidase [Nocardiopsis ansamitocini]|uniref:N-methyltryptophan oxidase n=1 Tax=Nocardiopsis ansamitocini TaxID=1670832 RepID=A0A9W6UK48_9ACTN|nr:N-methyl-L-tryptophan oxidase [Nocardiopsis ansamitocini]GLU49188.1 N-methyltryptophan oxidase [Nocardiopsis ansamitocini]
MPSSYDVIVIGLGGMGSAAVCHLARRGQRVLGLEQFGPAHSLGASHGGSRIYRQSYAEGPQYVPLLLRARELWDQLGRDAGESVFTRTGFLTVGKEGGPMVDGCLRSADEWGLEHELLDAVETRRRFPTFTPGSDEVAFYESQGGVARPEATVTAHLTVAERSGAELRFHTPALHWTADEGGGVRVTTPNGVVTAGRLVVAPGAWAPKLLPGLAVPLRVERRVMYWFAPEGGTAAFDVARHPVYIWEESAGSEVYGFPALDGPGGGVKVGFHSVGDRADPDRLDREIHDVEAEALRTFLRPRIPALAGPLVRGAACTYTLTPDAHFVVSLHPEHPQVTVACGFSGHGFKFVPVIGEILADLAVEGTTRHPIALFDARRR